MPVLTGYDSRVRFAFSGSTVTMHANRWSVSWRVDALESTTFVNANFGQYVSGVMEFDISVDCIYDTLSDPFFSGGLSTTQNVLAAGLQPGCGVGLTIDVTEGNATRNWSFPNAYVASVHVDDSVRDLVRYSVSLKGSASQQDNQTLASVLAAVPVG